MKLAGNSRRNRCDAYRFRRSVLGIGRSVSREDGAMDVAGVLERLAAQAEPLGRDDERVDLVPARGAVRSDLIVERDYVVAIVRTEQDAIAGVRLLYQR